MRGRMRLKNESAVSSKMNETMLLLASFLVGIYLFIFRSLSFYDDTIYTGSENSIFAAMYQACAQTLSHYRFMAAVFALVVSLFALGHFSLKKKVPVGKYAFKYRYLIALGILVLAVLLNLNGSSIGQWATSLPEGSNLGLVLGRSRGCRTDEYALFTGMTFAQYYDPQGAWPYFGEVIRGTTTDMFMVYGQPVLDLAILVRPFQIGYLVLGLSRGLSFFWTSRLLALFMSSFELGRLITGDNKKLSIAFGLLAALSPVVAWWFSINSFVEMLVSFNVIVVCFNKYVREQGSSNRAVYLGACTYSSVVFVFSLYPAWQVPLAYLLLAIVIAFAFEHRLEFKTAFMKDRLIWLACVLAAVAVCVGIGFHSLEAIRTEMATDYPGDRIDCGGGYGLLFFRGLISLFLPFVPASSDAGLAAGLPDVMTTFNDFFPLGLVLAVGNFRRSKKIDSLSAALIAAIIFIGVYVAIGFPEFMAKISLMGKSIPSRAIVIFSFANLILIFHELSVYLAYRGECAVTLPMAVGKLPKVLAIVVASAILTLLCWLNDPSFIGRWKFLLIFVVILIIMFSIFYRRTHLFIGTCLTVALFSGGLVNPIQNGIEVVDSNPLITEIREIATENEGSKWISSVNWMSNITLFAGAPAINSTNIYPNKDLWNLLDPTGESKTDWNRYAHLPCEIVSEEEGHSFVRTQLDTINLRLTLADLKALDVRFIISNKELTLPDEELSQLKTIFTLSGYIIYEIA